MFTLRKAFVALTLLNLSLFAAAQGTQFITGACTSDAICASGCCGFNSGKCAGPVVAQERDGGCGFGDPQPNDRAAQIFRNGGQLPPAAPAPGTVATPPVATSRPASPPPPQATTPARAPGTQFITGVCASDADCASACCGFRSGKCAGPVVAQERDGGCGFGDAQPNDRAAQIFRNGGVAPSPPPPPPPSPPTNNGSNGSPNTNTNTNTGSRSGKPPGAQFITGLCGGDVDCASGCCGFNSGRCAGPVVAQERDGGCGFGDAQPNDDAARRLRGRRYVMKSLLE